MRADVRRPALAAALIVVLCALLRIGLVDRQGLWADEFFSLAMATGHSLEQPADQVDPSLGDYVELPTAVAPTAYSRYLEHDVPPSGLGRVVRAVRLSDTSPPLYYLLLYVWTRAFGTGDAALRLFSVLCSLGCLPPIWFLARRLGGNAAAGPAALLFAISPLCVYYSTEGRMYSLLILASALSGWLTLAMWDKGSGPARFGLWIVAGCAGLLIHYYFLFVWIGMVIWLQIRPGRCPRRWSGAGALLTLLLVFPWYANLPASLAQWRVTGYWLTIRPGGYRSLVTPLALPWNFLSIDVIWGSMPFWDWLNAGIFVLLAIAALRQRRWSLFAAPLSLLWIWLLSSCLGLVIFDIVRGTYVTAVPRYALAGMPAAVLLVGVALGSLRPHWRALFLVMIVIVCAVGLRRLYRAEDRSFEPYAQLGGVLTRQTSDSDLILVHSIPSGVAGVARYLEREGAARTGVGFASWVGQLGRRRVPDDLRALAADRRRIVLVRIHEVGEPAPQQAWLEKNARLVETVDVHGVKLRYFAPADSTVFFPTGAIPDRDNARVSK